MVVIDYLLLKSRKMEEKIIIDDYLGGLSSFKIGEKYGCSKSKVLHILQKNGINRRSNKKTISQEQEKIVLEMYEKNTEIKQIREVVGLSESIIYSVLNRYKKVKNYHRRLPDDIREKIYNLFLSGLSAEEIRKQFSLRSTTAIYKILKEKGFKIERKAHNKIDENIRNKIINEYTNGLNICELHEKYGFGTTTIARWVRQAGVMRSLSSAFSLSANKGRKHFRGTNLPWYSTKNECWFIADSIWEAVRMEQLDLDEGVKKWEKGTERIPYIGIDGKNHYYIPDFKVFYFDGKTIVEEIKPANLTGTENNKTKFNAAKDYYGKRGILYTILTEKEIGIENINNFNPGGLISYTQEIRKERRRQQRNKRAKDKRYAKKNNANRSAT